LAWKLGPLVTVLPGVRAEYHGRYGNVVAPRFAIVVRPRQSITLRAGVGRGFRTPSAQELGFNFDHTVYGYKVVGNPKLTPERSWGINGDVNWAPLRAIALRAGAFYNWVDDLIDIDLAGGSANGAVVSYSYQNLAQVRTAGANLAAVFRAGERFRADLAYDYLWARDIASSEPVSGRPPHTLTASTQLELPWQAQLYARLHWVSSAYVASSTRTPPYQTLDLRLGRGLWPGGSGYVGVLNLFDVHQDPGRVGDLRPPLGRVLYIGLRSNFPAEDS